MQKTKLGISVGLLGAAIYFMGLFSGFFITVILAGYVLLVEDNMWLRKNAVKAVVLLTFLTLFTTGINLIPNLIGFINNLAAVFGGKFEIAVLSHIVIVIDSGIDIVEKVLFILLGTKALNQGTIEIPVVDKLIEKYV